MQLTPLLGGRYRLGPEIAAGGMGAVHRAWDETFQREVAIKLVRGDDAVEQERLRREARYLAQLDHPNLVAVLDVGADRINRRDTVWFAMELVIGPDLKRVLREAGALDGRAVRRVLRGVLAALGALHEAGMIHRDLKPANVLLTAPVTSARWEPKLVDLGIAHHARTAHLTDTGQVMGTAAYLSPEQVSGEPVGPPSDLYALGLVAIEALTGRVAFPGGIAETAAARLVRSPDLPSGLHPQWRAVLSAMTEREPGDRPSSARLAERIAALPDEALLSTAEVEALLPATEAVELPQARTMVLPSEWSPSLRTRPNRLRRVLMGAAGIAVAAGLAGGAAAVVGGSDEADHVAAATPSRSAASAARATPPAAHRPAASRTPAPSHSATPSPAVTAAAAAAEAGLTRHPAAAHLAERARHDLRHWVQRLRHGPPGDR